MKKHILFLVGSLFILSLTACSNTNKKDHPQQVNANLSPLSGNSASEIVKPEHITFIVDGSFMADKEDRSAIEKKFKELTGIELEIKDFDKYADKVEADVTMISSDYYTVYAAEECFWNMAQAWENSHTKASGRIDESVINEFYIENNLYGLPISSGNGCVTYIRKDWLDKLNLRVPTNYDEYLEVLRAFSTKDPDGNGIDDTYGVTATGLITNASPYIQYLPEFWQDAYPGIYQNQEGIYVDGFTEENMISALQRLKIAYTEGLIDQEVLTNIASNCREKFYSSKAGVITYKAGDWNCILEDNVKHLTPEAEIIAIPPIKEVKSYIKDLSFSLAIPSDCSNPEGVFKYFIEALMDGGEIQKLFTYGIEGIDWEQTEAGYRKMTTNEKQLDETNKMLINPILSISKWASDNEHQWLNDERATYSNRILQENCKLQPLVKSTDALINNTSEISDARNQIIVEIVTGDLSIDEGLKEYHDRTDVIMNEVLSSLNE